MMPMSNESPGLALAKNIKGSLTSRLSEPVVVNVPFTVKSPTQVMSPPTLRLPMTPAPPATRRAPVLMLSDSVVFVVTKVPLVLMLPVAPMPPVTVSAPVTLLVDAACPLKVARLAPATVATRVVALAQKKPVLLAATLTTLGAPTVPASNTDADRSRLLRAPPRKVTVMLLVPDAGGAENSSVTLPAV